MPKKNKLVLSLIIVFFIFILFLIWKSWKKAIWDGKHQLNFVVQAGQVMVFSLHPEDSILNILTISPETHIPVARNFGEYQIGNIYQLGELEKIDGGELLRLSLQEFLAVPIDGQIIVKNPKLKVQSQNESLEQGKLFPLYFCLLKRNCKTNLTWWDLTRVFLKINQLKPGQIKTIDFDQTGIIKEKILPDNSTILQPDYLVIDQLSFKLFSDKSALDERITVSVLNGTSRPGLAKKVARLVKNLGAEIISTGNTNNNFKKSVIYYSNEKIKDSYTLSRLVKTLQITKIEKNNQIKGDINLLLGEDFRFFL